MCPAPLSGAFTPDREAGTIVSHPEQGWSLLCNGVVPGTARRHVIGEDSGSRQTPATVSSTGKQATRSRCRGGVRVLGTGDPKQALDQGIPLHHRLTLQARRAGKVRRPATSAAKPWLPRRRGPRRPPRPLRQGQRVVAGTIRPRGLGLLESQDRSAARCT